MPPKRRVAILISGRGTNMQALIDACRAPNFPAEIITIISNVPNVAGLQKAEMAGISSEVVDHKRFSSRELFEDALHLALVASGAELVCLAGFMRLLSANFVKKWEGRMLNIHPSLLPAFKGLNTHERAIMARAEYGGCTVHFVSPEMDSGPIILQAAERILPDDTPETLAARVLKKEHICYPEALRLVAAGQAEIQGNQVIISGPTLPGLITGPAAN